MSYADAPVLTQEPPLTELTESIRQGKALTWYRSKLKPADMKALHKKSDLRGAFQTLGYLGIWVSTATLAFYSTGHWSWYFTILLTFLHGMVACFFINAVHELGHGTVFKTRSLNSIFCHLFAFFGWINHELFQSSHTRHHRYTLHPPDDLEVVLPIKLLLINVLKTGIVSFQSLRWSIQGNIRIARGGFKGEWELTLYPETEPGLRKSPVRWARCILLGHSLILLASLLTGHWMLTVLLSLSPFYGGWLFFFCNNTQHVGLQDNVDDFRLCCRTFTLNPVVRFLYWQMNYHIEHHMYAAVPCYNLKRLHELIKHDLPPTPKGLIGVWKEITRILRRQEKEPGYQHKVELPSAGS